ncbi:hypothetical protein L6452_34297 [Arctium lappa]|uniref:Uncharacterized protein n=1 Tax=Arctium lappa TaxID=4217 RepID=A0ACB8YH40_ARCLA|nr:hypothetical protein L6452_34297 [Arctium lappa]
MMLEHPLLDETASAKKGSFLLVFPKISRKWIESDCNNWTRANGLDQIVTDGPMQMDWIRWTRADGLDQIVTDGPMQMDWIRL